MPLKIKKNIDIEKLRLTKRVCVVLPKWTIRVLEAYAWKHQKTRSEVIRNILVKWAEEKAKELGVRFEEP